MNILLRVSAVTANNSPSVGSKVRRKGSKGKTFVFLHKWIMQKTQAVKNFQRDFSFMWFFFSWEPCLAPSFFKEHRGGVRKQRLLGVCWVPSLLTWDQNNSLMHVSARQQLHITTTCLWYYFLFMWQHLYTIRDIILSPESRGILGSAVCSGMKGVWELLSASSLLWRFLLSWREANRMALQFSYLGFNLAGWGVHFFLSRFSVSAWGQ